MVPTKNRRLAARIWEPYHIPDRAALRIPELSISSRLQRLHADAYEEMKVFPLTES